MSLNPLNAELNPICHLLALVGVHHILHVSGIRVKGIKKTFHHINYIPNSEVLAMCIIELNELREDMISFTFVKGCASTLIEAFCAARIHSLYCFLLSQSPVAVLT